MRLSCAFICSFLFVSAVLADYPEKQQPPLLNHVEKSFISLSEFPAPGSGGGVWMGSDPKKLVETATGVFEVPRYAAGSIESQLTMLMGIGSPKSDECQGFRIALGIGMTVSGATVTYQAFALWGTQSWDSTLPISAGSKIRAKIQVTSPTTALVTLLDLSSGESKPPVWTQDIGGGPKQDCRRGVEWIVLPHTDYIFYDQVVVTELSVKLVGENTEVEPERPDSLELHNYGLRGSPTAKSVLFYQKRLITVYMLPRYK